MNNKDSRKELEKIHNRRIEKRKVNLIIKNYRDRIRASKALTAPEDAELGLSLNPNELLMLFWDVKIQEVALLHATSSLKEFRMVRGFTVRTFARYLGISPTLLCFYEAGVRPIPLDIALKAQAILMKNRF